MQKHKGGVSILGFRPTGMGNSMLKLRRPTSRPNFNMELPILVGRNPDIVTAQGMECVEIGLRE